MLSPISKFWNQNNVILSVSTSNCPSVHVES